jgi:NAD(P)-dependent dehydrogenase (short-subunit alcohol dehydrogenase family)
MDLGGKRIVVVGASAGIGAVVAVQAAAAGAAVVAAARRADRLAAVVDRCEGGRAHAVECDVRDADACEALVARSVEHLGGLDAVVYSTAVDPLVRLIDTDAQRWLDVLSTNVVGASLVCRAAVPHLAGGGRFVFVSATSVGRPLPGMGAYETSKAALEELARAWRGEHPDVGFSTVAVGNTLGTEVTAGWDPALLGELAGAWTERGYVHDNGPGAMTVDAAASAVLSVLTSPADIRFLTANPPPGSTMEQPGG